MKLNTRRIIWILITVFILLAFYTLIPIDIYESHDMIYSFLGAGLFFIALAQVLADYESIYDLMYGRQETDEPEPKERKLVPYAVIPAIILSFVFVLHQSSRKKDELKQYGKLTKATIVNGEATTTTRRFKSSTSYDLIVTYYDSTNTQHTFEETVSSSEFKDAYKGQTVDLVYSKIHPSVATALLSLDDLSEYTAVANNKISVDHLIAILETNQADTILNFLNSINYQWVKSEDIYANETRDLAIKVMTPGVELAYIERGMVGSIPQHERDSFEGSLEEKGFKKKSVTEGDKTEEFYYNDKYKIIRENKSGSGSAKGISFYTVYHLFLNLDTAID